MRHAKQQQDLPSPSGHEALPYGHAIEISFGGAKKKGAHFNVRDLRHSHLKMIKCESKKVIYKKYSIFNTCRV